jgi:hypothetical protein
VAKWPPLRLLTQHQGRRAAVRVLLAVSAVIRNLVVEGAGAGAGAGEQVAGVGALLMPLEAFWN